MSTPFPPRTRADAFAWTGRLLLLLALVCALWAAWGWMHPAPENCEDPDSSCSVFDVGERRAEDFQLEKIGGKSAVFAARFDQWLRSWLQGARLATLLTAVFALAAWACRQEARLLREEASAETNAASKSVASVAASTDTDTATNTDSQRKNP